MDCAPSIHASESGTAHHSGEEAEDSPRPAAPPLSSGGSHLPQGQKTGLVESEPSDGRGKKVRGAGHSGATLKLGPGRAECPPGSGALLSSFGWL